MLILFDIDGTLLHSAGMGFGVMTEALRHAFADDAPEPAHADHPPLNHQREQALARVSFAGRLDAAIMHDLLEAFGVHPTPTHIDRLARAYTDALAHTLARTGTLEVCPGVHAIVDRLERLPWATLGVLTGNLEAPGRLKMNAAGLDPDRFPVHAWSSDLPPDRIAREHLPPIAIARAAELGVAHSTPERTVIIGDTPHDIACAKANGCRCIAVATGRHALDELEALEPDAALDSLAETDAVLDLLEHWHLA